MKKFFLYLGVIGFLPSAAMAASAPFAGATSDKLAVTRDISYTATNNAAQTTNRPPIKDDIRDNSITDSGTTNRKPAVTTINVRPSVDEFKTYTRAERVELVRGQLDDDSVKELTLNRQDILDKAVNVTIADDLENETPYLDLDGDITDANEFQTKYELDDNGIKHLDLTLSEFKPLISCKTHPQLCEIKEWDPEVEVVNPFENRLRYCTLYTNKCILRDDLVSQYISKWKILKPITYPRKIIPIASFKCLGVRCGEGQRCINGCCHYVKQLPEIVAPIALKPVLLKKYKLVNKRVVALPQALKDGTAKLVLNSSANKDLILDKKVQLERATNILQAKITALSK